MFLYIAVLAFTLYYLYQWKRRSVLPPGPVPLHVLGNLPQFALYVMRTGDTTKALQLFKKEYGDIFTIWFGPLPTVHIGTLELAHETMIKQGNNYANRWMPLLFHFIRDGHGVIVSNDDYWVEQRRFTLQTLRNFGVGRNLVEERIMMEFDMRVADLDEALRKDKNHVTDAKQFLDLMVGSIINRMLFSVRFTEENQEEFFVLKSAMDRTTSKISFLDLYVPTWAVHLPLLKQRYGVIMKPFIELLTFLENQIQERKDAIAKGDHIITGEGTDFVDAFLKKMEDEKDNPNTTFTHKSLVMNVLDLWAAGQETTTTTLLWGFNYLLNKPEVAKKAREEILKITKDSRPLSLKDRSDAPYLNATITEIQRHANILNINLFRRVKETTKIRDYVIDPSTPITAELSLIMNEEKLFENTDEFDPERFLKTEKLEQNVIPFGIGKRACPGESLARAELFLILGNLLSKYEILPVGKIPPMTPSESDGLFKRPDNFNIRLVPVHGIN